MKSDGISVTAENKDSFFGKVKGLGNLSTIPTLKNNYHCLGEVADRGGLTISNITNK